jgi:predicted secreted protein
VILSDGSSYKQLTTSPRGVIRSVKDIRNNPLWNPSMRELADIEEDEAGRLKRFRERFGMGFESESEEGAGEMESLLVSHVAKETKETKKKK